jgi:hypothetical protein
MTVTECFFYRVREHTFYAGGLTISGNRIVESGYQSSGPKKQGGLAVWKADGGPGIFTDNWITSSHSYGILYQPIGIPAEVTYTNPGIIVSNNWFTHDIPDADHLFHIAASIQIRGNHIGVSSNSSGHAIDISEPPVPRGPGGIDSSGFIIEGNAFWLVPGLGAINAENTITDSLVRGNTIVGGGSATAITIGSESAHNLVEGNSIRDYFGGTGISVPHATNNTIANNEFNNCSTPIVRQTTRGKTDDCGSIVTTTVSVDPDGPGLPYDGHGGLSAGASSRLLFDYSPDVQAQILDDLFLPKFGTSFQACKVEIGGDTASTDGTEASHMHDRDDLNCSRGYEFWLMKEARRRNPKIMTYGLIWGAPGWINNGTGFFGPGMITYKLNWLTVGVPRGCLSAVSVFHSQ